MAEDKNQEKDIIKDDKVVEETEATAEEVKAEEKKEKKSKKKEKKKTKEEELGEQLLEITDKYMRLSAEFDNYRKRTLKERIELSKTASGDVIMSILPVVDDFERAIKFSETSDDIKALKEGVSLIYNKLKDFLTGKGVKEIDAVNCDFDTDLHEAITKIPAPSKKLKGKVVDVIEKGYQINDKVIRYAKVVIGE